MTHVTRRLYDEIALSGCHVCTYDLATDIMLAVSATYYYNNHSPLQTPNIKSFSVTYMPHDEFLNIHIVCDDNRIYAVSFTFERLQSYKEVNK